MLSRGDVMLKSHIGMVLTAEAEIWAVLALKLRNGTTA
jgi:hypothetical protein